MWDADPSIFSSAEHRAEYVAESLSDFRFLYKFPNATVSTAPPV